MSIPNPQISDDLLPSQTPNLAMDQQSEDQQNPHSDSQSPKTLIPDPQDPANFAEQDDPNPQGVPQESEQPQDDCVEVQPDPQIPDDPDTSSAPSPRNADASSRRGPKRKKMGPKRTALKKKKKTLEKFQVLVETLKPIPFVPAKALDFTSHETLLRRLGLWDFVHIEFDRNIKTDLVAQLISDYAPSARYSYVNGIRIMLNRADLGRALKLPPKKKPAVTESTDDVLETLDMAESISFIEEVVSNWMLLHEDTYIMPSEVLAYTKMIKEGNLGKVDWAGLIWYMVEKELKNPQLVSCYYASHLQHLIKFQREEILREEPKVETEVKDEEEEEEEDEDGGGDLKMGGVEDMSGDLKMGGVEDVSGDLKMGGVEDRSGDLKMSEVEDGSGDLKMGGFEDGSGDLKMGGVKDVNDDLKMGRVEGENDDLKIGGVEDGNDDLKVGGVEDGSGDLKMGGAEDDIGVLKMGGVEDSSGDLKMGEAVDGSGDLKMGGVEDESDGLKMGRVEDGSSDLKLSGVDDGPSQELSEHNIELSLGQDNTEKVEVEKEQDLGEHIMDFEEPKEEEPGQWLLHRKNNVGEPLLRPCSFSEVNSLDCEPKKEDEGEEVQEGGEEEEEEEEEEEAEEDEHEGGFHLSPKCIPLEGMASGSLIQVMDAAQMPFNSAIELRDNSVGDFLSSREDIHMISGASLFNNGHKRDIAHDNNNSHHSLNGSNKRLRSDSPWNSKPADFEMCMEQIEHWMGKARMMYATKEQSCEESTMNQQLLLNELQKRDSMIEHLHKAKMEESQKRQMEVYRLEKELYMMSSLLDGYRKALKESQKTFAEYRALCPQADEPLYKDVPGSGGLVLSVMELEKERLKQEEEERIKRLVIEKKFKEIAESWIVKLEDHQNQVQLLGNRLLAIEDQVKALTGKRKVSAPPECVPSDEQTAE